MDYFIDLLLSQQFIDLFSTFVVGICGCVVVSLFILFFVESKYWEQVGRFGPFEIQYNPKKDFIRLNRIGTMYGGGQSIGIKADELGDLLKGLKRANKIAHKEENVEEGESSE